VGATPEARFNNYSGLGGVVFLKTVLYTAFKALKYPWRDYCHFICSSLGPAGLFGISRYLGPSPAWQGYARFAKDRVRNLGPTFGQLLSSGMRLC